MSRPMVDATLKGIKTVTRRCIQPQPVTRENQGLYYSWRQEPSRRCPYGDLGSGLWVRETHFLYGYWVPVIGDPDKKFTFLYERGRGALYPDAPPAQVLKGRTTTPGWYRRPSIHMPRWASRIDLEITWIKTERLQEITEAESLAEGVDGKPFTPKFYGAEAPRLAVGKFRNLWESINGNRVGLNWECNPWVWAISFRRVRP